MGNYLLKYFSEYQNRSNSFRLEILSLEPENTFVLPIEISAYCTLNYKSARSIFTPIRGASLNININSDVENQYSEFLSFNERKYKVKFLKNDILIFEGFINPTGISQSYSSPNWVATLVATDNLGTLKNLEFIYDNETPTEFVFLDLILKRTGLDLPIAFADGILSNNNTIAQPLNRLIDPEVFLNNNGRQTSCLQIIEDILIKYNASLCIKSVPIFNLIGEFIENRLVWFYYRSADLINFSQNQPQIPVYKINSYTERTVPFYGTKKNPNFIFLGLALDRFQNIKSESTQGESDSILVNSNAELRSINALQNFRFQQDWKLRGSLINFTNDYLAFNGDPNEIIVTNNNGNVRRSNFLSTFEDKPTFGNVGFPPQNTDNLFDRFVKSQNMTVLPTKALNLKIEGSAFVRNTTEFSFPRLIQNFKMFYTTPSGVQYVLKVIWQNDQPIISPTAQIDKEWELLSDANLNNISFYNHYLFFTNAPLTDFDVNFDIEIPTLPEEGGFVSFEFPFLITVAVSGAIQPDLWNRVFAQINDFKLIAESNPVLGTGEFHDAIRLNFASTNLEDVQNVINADEPTNLFKNGLQRVTNSLLVNYTEWKNAFEGVTYPNLLQLTSLERVKLRRFNSMVVNTDVLGFIKYGSIVKFVDFNDKFFVILGYQYNTINDTIKLEIAEIFPFGNDNNFEYEQSFILENEVNVLIRE